MKVCKKCGESLPLESFYKDSSSASGYRSACKTCHKKTTDEWRSANAEKRRETNRRYRERNRGKFAEHDRKYNESHKAEKVERNRAWYAADPRRRKAHNAVLNELRQGRMTRPDACQGCGARGQTEASHHDYDNPLEVEWLCPTCHRRKDLAK